MTWKPRLSIFTISCLVACGGAAFALSSCRGAKNDGKFSADWTSLEQYVVPEWYRDAKFGIWAHWGPQCEAEAGDWYARNMYIPNHRQYKIHCERYGHPSQFGFKDVINEWKAERFDAQYLVDLYKESGAQYFVAMANHHDNFDLWDSQYQPWNSVNMGPKRDIIGLWAAAAKKAGLPFGVSIHASSAWSWYEPAQLCDSVGPWKGIPFDGNLTREDGKGQWWEGYDPQDLYAQYRHRISDYVYDRAKANAAPGDLPSEAYLQKYYDRVMDLVQRYEPELLYFDDSHLPLIANDPKYGLSIAANAYNLSMARNGGVNKAVINAKNLTTLECRCLVDDLEGGTTADLRDRTWQSDACIGGWHYRHDVSYASAGKVIKGLIDVVSKNGNLLLNIPIRGDGTIDDKELAILKGIGAWLRVNGEAIYGTRSWVRFGEGPAIYEPVKLNPKGHLPVFRKDATYTSEDIRFTVKGDVLYAIVMGWPESGEVCVKSLALDNPNVTGKIRGVSLLGCDEPIAFAQTEEGLQVTMPVVKPNEIAYVLKIEGLNLNN